MIQAKRDERYERQAQERRLRQEERVVKLRGKNGSPKRKPLYLQMEEQYRQKEAHEEARRRETLKSQRAKFEPVRRRAARTDGHGRPACGRMQCSLWPQCTQPAMACTQPVTARTQPVTACTQVDFAELGKETDELRRHGRQEWDAKRKDEKQQALATL